MNAPKFMSFEELARDHERLSAEVEGLKKLFEVHGHHTINQDAVGQPIYPMEGKIECAFCNNPATEFTQTCEYHRPR